jgi:hypothetical protein
LRQPAHLSHLPDGFGGIMFGLGRAKTGKAAAATLTQWSLALLVEYIASLPFTLHPETPIFHTRGGAARPQGRTPSPARSLHQGHA